MVSKAKEVLSAKRQKEAIDTAVLKKLRIVIRAADRHSAWIEKHCGISGAQLWVLQELHDAPGLKVGEVAAKLAVHQTTASNLLNALLEKEYIEKIRDLEDQRVVKLVLSKKGLSLLNKAPKPARGLLAEALMKLDEDNLNKLNEGLGALMAVIESADDSHGLQPFSFML